MRAIVTAALRIFSHNQHYKFARNTLPYLFSKRNYQTNRLFTHSSILLETKNTVTVTFLDPNGDFLSTATGPEGSTILELAKEEGFELYDDYGQCGGGMTCASCHVILKRNDFYKVTEKIHSEEKDLLETCSNVEKTSRLGCQVRITKELDGIMIKIGGYS